MYLHVCFFFFILFNIINKYTDKVCNVACAVGRVYEQQAEASEVVAATADAMDAVDLHRYLYIVRNAQPP